MKEENIPLKDEEINNKQNIEEERTPKSVLYCYSLIIILSFIFITFLFFYIHYGRYHIEILVTEKDMIKPLVDDRKYRVIKLTNNLEVLMISDVSTSRCSSSMSVGVGSFQDDDDILGLAHFTEHMIFLGSKSYPRPGEFEEHLSNYFGLTNAFTEDEKTTFYFDIGCRGFQKSLIMFSRMFAEPLFDLNYMNKEIEAVNSENEKNLNQDSWKEHQLLKHLSNPTHPYNRFNTGNNVTLRNVDKHTLHKRLNAFYNKYYTPNNMKLVVLSNQNLDNIENTVAQYFSDIRLDSLQKEQTVKYGEIRTNTNAFGSDELGKIVWYQKIAQSHSVDIVFVLDEIISNFLYKPLDYVIYLLKYIGKGSLFNYLKTNKYATKMDVGLIASYKNFSEFAITISLTEEGLQNITSVLDSTFNYINLIKMTNIDSSYYEEIKNITKINFKFLEKNEKYGENLASLAGNMFDYNYNEILYGDYIHSAFNETLIRTYLNNIKPENSLILIGSQNLDNQTKTLFRNSTYEFEPWYSTKYIQSTLNDTFLNRLNVYNNTFNFKLRPKNEYITTENNIVSCLDDMNKDICNQEMATLTPKLYLNQSNFKIWYKLDRSFLIPKVNINLNIITPYLRSKSSENFILSIFNNYLKNNIEIAFSELKDTGGEITMTFDENGFVLSLSLFTDLVPRITDKLLDIIFNPRIDESIYNQLLQSSIDQLKDKIENQPYVKAQDLFKKIIKYGVSSNSDTLNFLNNVTYKDFNKTLNNILNSFTINSLFYGYLQVKSLNEIIDKINTYLNNITLNTFKMIDYLHTHKIISQPVIYRTVNDLQKEHNHVVYNYFQVGARDYKLSLVMNIIEMIWGNMFYFSLRTVSQLGYIVSANKEVVDNYMYYTFIVQGNKENPSSLNLEIDKVIANLRDKVVLLNEEKFQEIKTSLKNELHSKDANLKERTSKIWNEIFLNSLDFNRKDKLTNEIVKINRKDILEAYDTIFIDKPQKLSIQIYSGDSKLPKNTEELYYLNSNIIVTITSDVNVLNQEIN